MLRQAQHEKNCNRRYKKNRRGVTGITLVAQNPLHVEGIGSDSRVRQERSRTMKRQTRLNLAALLVALPMVLVAATTAVTNFP